MFLFCAEIDDPKEREAIYALRYAVLVEELGRPHRYADPVARRLEEPVDADAIHVGAYVAAEDTPCGPRRARHLVGALRIHAADRADFSFLAEVHPDLVRGDGVRRGAVTRLVTAPEARGRGRSGTAGLELAVAAYRIALRESLDVVHIDCHADLRPFFTWLGFDLQRAFAHPDYGDIAVMTLRIADRERLERTRSPFLPVLDAAGSEEAPGSHPSDSPAAVGAASR